MQYSTKSERTKMKPISSQLFCTYTAFLLQVISTALATCPKNALDRFQECTEKILPDLSQKSLSQGQASYTKQVKDASDSCRDSRLNDVTDCIRDILDRCDGNTKEEITLRRLVDKDKMLKTVDYFCKNLRIYEKNAECIYRHHEEVNTCSKNAMKTFESKIKSGASFDDLISESCRFHSTGRSCLTKTTEIRCGQEAAEFVFQLLTGTLPPHCISEDFDAENPKYTPYDSDNGSRQNPGDLASYILPSHALIVLLLCLIMLCRSFH